MCVRIDPTTPELFTQRFGKPIATVILCHPEEKDLECTNRLMVVIWKSLNENQECQLELGKMGIAVSPVNSNRLYALIENTKGGLYRSDDDEHWELINEDKNLWQRPWYYMNLQADPKTKMV
jgi:hypothetical protein